MKSTGEVMGIDRDFGRAFAKAQIAAGAKLPLKGTAFISVKDDDKDAIIPAARKLESMGFKIIATSGTAQHLKAKGVNAEFVYKVVEGRPHIVDKIKSGEIAMVINTAFGVQAITDSYSIRRTALVYNVPYFTTISGAKAAAHGIGALITEGLGVTSIQEYHNVKNKL